jgi:hypothetical protein
MTAMGKITKRTAKPRGPIRAATKAVEKAEAIVKPIAPPEPKERSITHYALGLQEALKRQHVDVYTIDIEGQLDAKALRYSSRIEPADTGVKWTVKGELARGLHELVRRILLGVLTEPTHKHAKGGLYHLVGYSEHAESGAIEAVYRDMDGKLWHRPKAMFDDGRFVEVGK